MLKLGIAGNPVFHSKGTVLFQLLAKKYSVQLQYLPISTPNCKSLIDFSNYINLDGFNITTPLKQSIMELMPKIDYQASNLNSVNTVLKNNNSVVGYNTDYFGILQTIWDKKLIFNKKKVVILGSGSAARTAAFAIRNLNAKIFIWDRNEEKAAKVADELVVSYISDNKLVQQINKFDYIISTIPPNSKILRELKFADNQIIIDTIYHNSFFDENQKIYNYNFISGYNWLINQALLSFEMFTGIHSRKDEIAADFFNQINKKNKNFLFIGSSKSIVNELLNHLAEQLNLNIINSNRFDEILEKLKKSQGKNLLTLNLDDILIKHNTLELFKEFGNIIWLFDPNSQNEKNADFLFSNSNYIFILSQDIQESKERIVSEIERII